MKTMVSLERSFNAGTHYRTIFDIDNKYYVIVKNYSVSNSYSKDMFISNVSVNDNT